MSFLQTGRWGKPYRPLPRLDPVRFRFDRLCLVGDRAVEETLATGCSKSARETDSPLGIKVPVRVPADLPDVTVRVGKVAGVPAPEGILPRL